MSASCTGTSAYRPSGSSTVRSSRHREWPNTLKERKFYYLGNPILLISRHLTNRNQRVLLEFAHRFLCKGFRLHFVHFRPGLDPLQGHLLPWCRSRDLGRCHPSFRLSFLNHSMNKLRLISTKENKNLHNVKIDSSTI